MSRSGMMTGKVDRNICLFRTRFLRRNDWVISGGKYFSARLITQMVTLRPVSRARKFHVCFDIDSSMLCKTSPGETYSTSLRMGLSIDGVAPGNLLNPQ